jgi:hypothetical protein
MQEVNRFDNKIWNHIKLKEYDSVRGELPNLDRIPVQPLDAVAEVIIDELWQQTMISMHEYSPKN